MQGLPQFLISGLPDAACKQSPDRIKAAAANSGVPVPNRRWTVNLSPASMPKGGSGFDLPIAIAVLAAAGLLPVDLVAPMVHIGELGLDGSVRPVRGVLPAVMAAARLGVTSVVVPADNAAEAALVPGMRVLPARHLSELVCRYRLLDKGGVPQDEPVVAASVGEPEPVPDLRDVVGQDEAGWRSRSRRRVGTTCSWSDRRAPARRCWPSGCRRCCRALDDGARAGGHGGPLGRRGAAAIRRADPPATVRRRRTTRPRWRRSSAAAAASPVLARSPGPPGVLFLDEAPEFSSARAQRAATAAGGRRGDDRPASWRDPLPGAGPARAGGQPVPVRRGSARGPHLHVLAVGRAARYHGPAVGAAAGPGRPAGDAARGQAAALLGEPGRAGDERRCAERVMRPGSGGRPGWPGTAVAASTPRRPDRCCAAAPSGCRARRPPTWRPAVERGSLSRRGASTGCSGWRGPCGPRRPAAPTRADVGQALQPADAAVA